MLKRTSVTSPSFLRRECPEHGCRPDWKVAQPNLGCGKNGITDGRRDDRRTSLAETDRGLGAVDEFDVEIRHVTDEQRRVAIEVRVLYLAFDKLGSLIQPC
jgi:hypothetical protein